MKKIELKFRLEFLQPEGAKKRERAQRDPGDE